MLGQSWLKGRALFLKDGCRHKKPSELQGVDCLYVLQKRNKR